MKTLASRIYIHPITVAYIALALLLGRFSFLFFHILLTFIHEMFHAITAVVLKQKVKEIVFLPIGFYAKIENLEDASIFVQLLVLIAGPLSFFFSSMILTILYRNDYISIYGFNSASEANMMVLIFNLIPIIPLDGGKIVKVILSRFLDEYKARIISLVISVIASLALLYYGLANQQLLVVGFIIFNVLFEIISLKKSYRGFLLRRLYNNRHEKIKISTKPVIHRFFNNYHLHNGKLDNERTIIAKILHRLRSKKQF